MGDGRANQQRLTFTIGCADAAGAAHTHEVTLEARRGGRGIADPPPVTFQYTCPITGQSRKATVQPTSTLGRPIVVVDVA